jgi:hypothetical protein
MPMIFMRALLNYLQSRPHRAREHFYRPVPVMRTAHARLLSTRTAQTARKALRDTKRLVFPMKTTEHPAR